jgi:hypothetical protein
MPAWRPGKTQRSFSEPGIPANSGGARICSRVLAVHSINLAIITNGDGGFDGGHRPSSRTAVSGTGIESLGPCQTDHAIDATPTELIARGQAANCVETVSVVGHAVPPVRYWRAIHFMELFASKTILMSVRVCRGSWPNRRSASPMSGVIG